MGYNVGDVLGNAGKNASSLELSNQQSGSEASAFDVWTRSYEGMSQRMRDFADDPAGTLARHDRDLDAAVTAGLTGDWHTNSFSAAADSIAAQAGGLGDAVNAISEADGALATVGATFALLTGVEQMLSTLVSVIPFPALPAIRITDMDVGLPHAHSHPPNLIPPAPPVPLPSTGPIIPIPILSGATRTLINGMPAARCGDMGLGIWCGGFFPMYEVFLGSSSVWIEGGRAGRLAVDITKHCVFTTPKPGDPPIGPMVGVTVAASGNVLIGGVPMPSLLSMAMGAAIKGLMKGLGKVASGFERATRGLRQRLFRNMKPNFLRCRVLRAEPVNILTGDVSVEQDDFTLPGRIPVEWTRSYSSGSRRTGACGYGWETLADVRLEVEATDGIVSFHHPTIGPLFFAQRPTSTGDGVGELELMDGARLTDHVTEFRVRTKGDRVFHFPKSLAWTAQEGSTEYPVARIADLCGNSLWFERRGRHLTSINESAGRRLEIVSKHDRITEIALRVPETEFRHVYVRYEYNAEGDLVSVIDALNHPHRFAYDDHHIARHTDRRGLSFYYEYEGRRPGRWRVVHSWGDGGLYDYRFEYDDVQNERRVINSLGHAWLVKLDERGLPIRELDPLGGTTSYEYDDRGRTTAVVDPSGHRTAYQYDDRGNLLKLTRPDGTTIQTAFNAADKAVAITDPNGAQWQQTWDARGRVLDQTSPLGSVSRFESDARGQLVAFADARGARTELAFDGVGNLTSLKDALGYRSVFTYDALGNVTSRLDPLEHRTLYTYDAKSRLISVRLPSGASIGCTHDAENDLIHYVEANGAETSLEYIGLSEIAKRILPDGQTIEYHYDTEENLIGVTNQRAETYRLQRDALGQIVTEVDYWGQPWRYVYAAGGRLTEATDPLGRVIRYTTDPLGRILKKIVHDPAQPEVSQVESFEYDANGCLLTCLNSAIRIARQFDPEGRLLKEEQGMGCVISNAYDAGGNRISRTTIREIAGRRYTQTVRYGYDALDQAIRVEVDGDRPIEFRRNALGQLTEERLSTAVRRGTDYGADGYCSAQHVFAAERPVVDQRFGYDANGNLLEKHDAAFGIDQYTYDPLSRLTAHLDPQGRLERFLNDPAGDRLQTRVHGAGPEAHDPEWRREGEYNGRYYRFDRAGNLTQRAGPDGDTRFTWDSNQRLTESTNNGKTTAYDYDPLGRRVRKQTGDTTTHFCWDGDVLLGDATVSDEITRPTVQSLREWVFYPQTFEPLALVQRSGTMPNEDAPRKNYYYYHNDPNGCATRLLDAAGNVVWTAQYGGWGRLEQLHLNLVDNPIRLQGQYQDWETGLHYNRYRYYDADAGQFISLDPLGLLGGLQLYISIPNVLSWIDPLGLAGCTLPKALKRQFRNIEELAGTPGNRGIKAALTPRELRRLGEEFVGEGYTIERGARHGELWMVSADGKRLFRSPTPKNSPFARTGEQANFHQRNNVRDDWFNEGAVSNVHVHSQR